MENNKKIENLVNEFKQRVNKNIIENTEFESTGEFGEGGVNCQYDIENDLYRLLFKLGKIIENKDLQTMYVYTRTIEELVEEIKSSDDYLENYEEFEVVDEIEEVDGSRYILTTYIVKYIPNGKFYMFYRRNDNPYEFVGEVKKKEIKTYEWVEKD